MVHSEAGTKSAVTRREAILALVCSQPGIRFNHVAQQTGARGTTAHHVGVLCKKGLVVRDQHGRAVHLFPATTPREARQGLMLLQYDGLHPLWLWLWNNGPAVQKAVLAAMTHRGWSRSVTQHRLARLERAGLVTTAWKMQFKIYTARPIAGLFGENPLPAAPRSRSAAPLRRIASIPPSFGESPFTTRPGSPRQTGVWTGLGLSVSPSLPRPFERPT